MFEFSFGVNLRGNYEGSMVTCAVLAWYTCVALEDCRWSPFAVPWMYFVSKVAVLRYPWVTGLYSRSV